MTRSEHQGAERGGAEHGGAEHGGAEHRGTAHDQAAHDQAAHDQAAYDQAAYEGFDCSRARLQFFEYLDGEMGPDDCARIREHLASCGPCLKEYDIDQTLKALVRRSCGREAAPRELRMQIMSRITTVIVTVELKD